MSWELSVDVPVFNGLHDETVKLGLELWNYTIATAISSSVVLLFMDYAIHKEQPAVSIAGGFGSHGQRFETPAPRSKSGVLSFNTHHDDGNGRRRHYLYGMPNNWQGTNGLTSRGWDGCFAYAHLLAMGLQSHSGAGNIQHLLAYWNVLPVTLDNLYGVAFRRVLSYNVFEHTDKAPDQFTTLWPPTGS